MARFALQTSMCAGQVEISLRVVIETPMRPPDGRMAGAAIRTETSFMAVVVRMARYTPFIRVAEPRRLVAFRAGHIRMLAHERKPCQPMVKPHGFFPSVVIVALLALRTLLSRMGVIVAVARDACHLQPHLAGRLNVTGVTREPSVGAAQRKLRLARVIEAGLTPIPLVVTLLAGGAVTPLVSALILFAMAREAVGGQPHLPCRLHVAGLAFDRRVPTAQRKPGAAVIEARHAPALRGMTLAAIRPQGAAMGVVFTVTRDAVSRRAVPTLVGVARCATRAKVRPLQREARIRVVEADLVPRFVRMARAAPRPNPATMRVIRAMALDARARRLAILAPRRVA